ncbi:hypothetical protein Ancab_004438 [Ancistrocladus abbreviatus]
MQAAEIDPHIKEKGDEECVSWDFLHAFIMQQQEDDLGLITTALAVYGLFIFPKALGYIDGRVIDLFHQAMHGVDPVPAILAETFRSLNYCLTKALEITGYTGLAGGLTGALAPEIRELADYNMAGYSGRLAPGVDSFTGILVLTGLLESGLVAFSFA